MVWNWLHRTHVYLFYDLVDPRVQHLPFMGSPYLLMAVQVAYLYFVLSLGPRMMANRPPFKLKVPLALFNVFQISISWFYFYKCLALGWGTGEYKLFCQPVDYSDEGKPMEIAYYVWGYMMLKIIDLIDTVFIVLKKNQRQVTFLHLYHHTGVAGVIWAAANYFPGGHGTSIGLINSFVHGIMYSYYLLTTIFPSYKANIGWKKRITQLQMLQFVLLILHSISVLLIPDCEYQCKNLYAAFMVPQNVFMLILFYNFYRKSYFGSANKAVNGALPAKKDAAAPEALKAVQNGKKIS